MAKKKHTIGAVVIELPEGLTITEQAQKISAEDKKRLPKPWKTVNSTARDTAAVLETHPDKLRTAAGDDAAELLRINARSEAWNPLRADLRAALTLVENANAIDDAALHALLLRLRSQLKVQLKDNPELADLFAALLNYSAR